MRRTPEHARPPAAVGEPELALGLRAGRRTGQRCVRIARSRCQPRQPQTTARQPPRGGDKGDEDREDPSFASHVGARVPREQRCLTALRRTLDHRVGRSPVSCPLMVDGTPTLPDTAEQDLVKALVDAVFTAAPVGLGIWGTDLRYERVNEALATMNGRPAAEHVGRTVHEVLGEHGRHVAGMLQEVLGRRAGLCRTCRCAAGRSSPTPGTIACGRPATSRCPARPVSPSASADRPRGHPSPACRAGARRPPAPDAHLACGGRGHPVARRGGAARGRGGEGRGRGRPAAHRRPGPGRHAAGRLMDYERTLGEVARSAVPDVADWCSITLRRPDGALQTAATAHRDRERERIAGEVTARYPPQPEDPVGAPRVIRTGQIELLEEISEADVQALARDPEHALLLRALGLRTSLVVPLHARGADARGADARARRRHAALRRRRRDPRPRPCRPRGAAHRQRAALPGAPAYRAHAAARPAPHAPAGRAGPRRRRALPRCGRRERGRRRLLRPLPARRRPVEGADRRCRGQGPRRPPP